MKTFTGAVLGFVLLYVIAEGDAILRFSFIAAVGFAVYKKKPWTWRKKYTNKSQWPSGQIGAAIVGMGWYIVIAYFVIVLVIGFPRWFLPQTYDWYVVGAVVLLVVLIQLWRRRWKWENFLESPSADMEKNHVYFEDEITTPLIEYFQAEEYYGAGYFETDTDIADRLWSEVEGYYLIDEGILRIHGFLGGDLYGQQTKPQLIEWDVSSEEDAELVFDMFVESEIAKLKTAQLDILVPPEFYDPNDPEWDWGGSYLTRDWEAEELK